MRPGFTLIEVVITLVLAGILLAIAVPRIEMWRSTYAASNARNALVMLGARAQAAALEVGGDVCLTIDPAANTAVVEGEETGAEVDRLNYSGGRFQAELSTSAGELTRCYTVRGFARPPTVSGVYPATVTFTVGEASAQAIVHALGDIEPI